MYSEKMSTKNLMKGVPKNMPTKIAFVKGGALSIAHPLGNNVRLIGVVPLGDFLNPPLRVICYAK